MSFVTQPPPVSQAYVDAGDVAAIATAEAYTDGVAAQNFSGTYVPVFTDLSATPLQSATAVDDFQYLNIGGTVAGIVTVSGAVDIKFGAILSTQLVRLEITLPVFNAIAFNSEGSCAGTACGLDTNTGLVIFSGLVKANVADSMAELDLVQLVAFGANNFRVFLHFTYKGN